MSNCTCNVCGVQSLCTDKFCQNCGNLMAKQNYSSEKKECSCSQCFTKNSCQSKFCSNCGGKISGINQKFYDEIVSSLDGIIVALLAKIAKADGRISQEEANYISSAFDVLSKNRIDSSKAKDIYKEILKQEKDKTNNIDQFCTKLSKLSIDKDFKIQMIEIFVSLAFVDGVYDESEENIIVKIVHHLGLDFSIYQNIKNKFEPKQESNNTTKNTNLTLQESYTILESKESDSLEIIKINYRRLIKQYHYDSISSKDLPKDLMDFAEERTKLINSAYEKIKKSRGV